MLLSSTASKLRIREAQNARRTRQEIIKALADGQITRRDLFKWGLFTTGGLLLWNHGLNPFVRSAYAAVPTGFPRSPLFGVQDRKSTRLNSSHRCISYAVFCLKKKIKKRTI